MMTECLICQTPYQPFMSFGKMPIANGFLGTAEFPEEYFFELKIGFCQECHMVQLAEQPDREQMFNEAYAFFSSTSTRMAEHFREFAELVMSNYLPSPDPFVVELGSNDGIMLQNFKNARIRHLGVEPSANVAQVAQEKGIKTISRFFDEEFAREIVAENGQADAILGANVMCHIPYLHSVVAGMKMLLKRDGIIMFEDPYLGDIIEKTSYDQIYDEHAFYFSVSSISYLFERHGLEVIDIIPQHVHGGSMRYLIAHKGERKVAAAVAEQRAKEERLGLHQAETYEKLRLNIERSRDALMELLRDLKNRGKRVVGYGATSKSTTITNYCGITPGLIEFISDTTPIKQNKYSPGVHIPVRPYHEFAENYPDYALLFAWNHAGEIMAKEEKFQSAGGQWIVYVPEVQVLG
jgi:methylation protein EvaC